MQAIVETSFDVVYLTTVITIGILMIRGSRGNRQFRLFGTMAVLLGAGDAFHLIPRAVALCTTGLENFTVPLGLGKWITSITMTVFYVLLYYVWRLRYHIQGRGGTTAEAWRHDSRPHAETRARPPQAAAPKPYAQRSGMPSTTAKTVLLPTWSSSPACSAATASPCSLFWIRLAPSTTNVPFEEPRSLTSQPS